MPYKKKIDFPTPMYDAIDIPHHKFKKIAMFTACRVCGFILGSGGGSMPPCQVSTEEEIAARTESGKEILKKLCNIS